MEGESVDAGLPPGLQRELPGEGAKIGLRWIMGEWAVRLLHRDPRVRAWAAPMLRRIHKNKVRMALTRRLLVGVWVMLTRGEVFSLERCLGRAA